MLWPVLLLFGLFSCAAADEKACTLHQDGKYYDLNPLKASKDYEMKTPGGHMLVINACRTLLTETHALKDSNAAETAGFVRRDRYDFSIGALNTTLTIEDSRPRLTLQNGSRCKSKSDDSQIRASTVVEFVCDTSVFGSGQPRLVAQLPPGDDEEGCSFFIEWKTHVACPTNEPGGAWGFFTFLVVSIISILMIYMVAGTLYNRYVLQLRGLDQIPQFSIESMKYHAHVALDWLQDLAHGTRANRQQRGLDSGPFSGRFPHNSSGTTVNPFSHQTQTSSAASGGSPDNELVRPQPTRTGSRKAEINRISHQSQIQAQAASQAELGNSPTPPLPSSKKQKPRPAPFDLEGSAQEREFMLGDDEDEDEGEDVGTLRRGPAPDVVPARNSGDDNVDNTPAMRGRDLGSKGVIRL